MSLPLEVKEVIARGLSGKDILTLCSTNRQWRAICQDENFWRELVLSRKGYLPENIRSFRNYFFELENFSRKQPRINVDLYIHDEPEDEYVRLYEIIDDLLVNTNYSLDPVKEEITRISEDEAILSFFVRSDIPVTRKEFYSDLSSLVRNLKYTFGIIDATISD